MVGLEDNELDILGVEISRTNQFFLKVLHLKVGPPPHPTIDNMRKSFSMGHLGNYDDQAAESRNENYRNFHGFRIFRKIFSTWSLPSRLLGMVTHLVGLPGLESAVSKDSMAPFVFFNFFTKASTA